MDRSTRSKTINQEEESKLDPVQALQMKIMEEDARRRTQHEDKEAKQKEEERKSRMKLEEEEAKQNEEERKLRMKLAEKEAKQKEEDRRFRREADIPRMEHKEDTEEQLGSGCYSCGNTGHLAKHCPRRIKDEPVKRIMKCQVNQRLDGTVNEQTQDGVGKRVQVRKLFKRPFVKVQVQEKQFCDSLVDSGAEVCCISKKLFDALNLERMGQLRIVGLDGQSRKVDATWVTVTLQIKHCEVIAPSVEVWCAIIPDTLEKLLITPDVVERLKGTEEYAVPLVSLEGDTRNASGKAIRRRIKTFDGLAQEGKEQMFYDPEVGLTQWEPWN
ncbi:hypothetical protein HELRODRAFT_158526 [Helobdella robusta]|uniref:CCHC-type domain-containing protein n=1 Tax=Helobdella robusta TaxID=6412 RepID=T1EMW9_HELRO|nr:hypothetical protein HELRODRAFT_158526 [Helobdella robusta]ESO12101.1 hypothetical protein HELRODRAFT_158526 [Helobdella robusta]